MAAIAIRSENLASISPGHRMGCSPHRRPGACDGSSPGPCQSSTPAPPDEELVEQGQEHGHRGDGHADGCIERIGADGPPAPGIQEQSAEGLAAEEVCTSLARVWFLGSAMESALTWL